jgi:hypothetical protein
MHKTTTYVYNITRYKKNIKKNFFELGKISVTYIQVLCYPPALS